MCGKLKGEREFSISRAFKDGLRYWCKACESKYQHKYYLRTSKVERRNFKFEQCHRTVGGVKEKRCRRCKKWLPERDFYKNRRNRDGLGGWCKECASKSSK